MESYGLEWRAFFGDAGVLTAFAPQSPSLQINLNPPKAQ